MPTIPFTVRKLESLKKLTSSRVDFWDEDDTPGFGLRISAAGKRTWVAMYRTKEGRQRRLKLGTFPPMTLADARDEAREALRAAQKGKDPAEARDKERSADTIKALANLYIDKHAKPTKRSWKIDQRMLNRDVILAWGARKARSIRRRDIIDLLDKIFDRGAPIMANRTYTVIRRMFRFAVERDIVDASPCVGVTKPGKEHARERVLAEPEIRAVWKAMDAEPQLYGAILKLRLITAQRGAEVRSMRWSDIDPAIDKAEDSAWWTIPGEFTKKREISPRGAD